MDNSTIPFNKPYFSGREMEYIIETNKRNMLSGDGFFTKKCHEWLSQELKVKKALLTHSCTAALEISAILIDVKPGDEIIMPSYTFVSTANAFVMRGGIPVFVDIRPDTLNIDESLIELAITKRTKAIVPVHYAGVSAEMTEIMRISRAHSIKVIEDSAQGILSKYKGQPLGGIGDIGALSFHETKNIVSGEGGALLLRDNEFSFSAEVIREKGTDRSRFFRGEVDKYTWQSIGSSFLPGELISAFLWAQLQSSADIISKRLGIWNNYYSLLETLELEGLVTRPYIPLECEHNGHIFYVIIREGIDRKLVLDEMKNKGVHALYHYVPLHNSPGGYKYGKTCGKLIHTEDLSERIIRLPLWVGMSKEDQSRVVEVLVYSINVALKKS